MKHQAVTILLLWINLLNSCQPSGGGKNLFHKTMESTNSPTALATFGTGCFWCTEAQFQLLEGVIKVLPGYSGGVVVNPSYQEVCSGTTGHAEVVQITYDPVRIRYEELLEAFWLSHDPTQLNRQGNDIGTQYRSVIFYHNAEQEQVARQQWKQLNDNNVYPEPVVTEITAFTAFYPAEEEHIDYYRRNGSKNPYCSMVVRPKVEKFKSALQDKIRQED